MRTHPPNHSQLSSNIFFNLFHRHSVLLLAVLRKVGLAEPSLFADAIAAWELARERRLIVDLTHVIGVLLAGVEAMRAIRNAILMPAHVLFPLVVDFYQMVLELGYSVELHSPAVPICHKATLRIVIVHIIHMMVVLDMLLQVVPAFEAVFPAIFPAMRARMTRDTLLMA